MSRLSPGEQPLGGRTRVGKLPNVQTTCCTFAIMSFWARCDDVDSRVARLRLTHPLLRPSGIQGCLQVKPSPSPFPGCLPMSFVRLVALFVLVAAAAASQCCSRKPALGCCGARAPKNFGSRKRQQTSVERRFGGLTVPRASAWQTDSDWQFLVIELQEQQPFCKN